MKNTSKAYKIGEKKKHKVMDLLDEISKEIGLYEEFVKRGKPRINKRLKKSFGFEMHIKINKNK